MSDSWLPEESRRIIMDAMAEVSKLVRANASAFRTNAETSRIIREVNKMTTVGITMRQEAATAGLLEFSKYIHQMPSIMEDLDLTDSLRVVSESMAQSVLAQGTAEAFAGLGDLASSFVDADEVEELLTYAPDDYSAGDSPVATSSATELSRRQVAIGIGFAVFLVHMGWYFHIMGEETLARDVWAFTNELINGGLRGGAAATAYLGLFSKSRDRDENGG